LGGVDISEKLVENDIMSPLLKAFEKSLKIAKEREKSKPKSEKIEEIKEKVKEEKEDDEKILEQEFKELEEEDEMKMNEEDELKSKKKKNKNMGEVLPKIKEEDGVSNLNEIIYLISYLCENSNLGN
jgi:beta-N-acetylglucosaminidase